jgi:hypothetical protein
VSGRPKRRAARQPSGCTVGEDKDTRKKRYLFDEVIEGFDALADQRAGKRMLRTHVIPPRIIARERAKVRARNRTAND